MRIAIFGITGNVGSRIAREARSRGHEVMEITRAAANVTDPESVAAAVRDADAVVSAVGSGSFDRSPFLKDAVQALIAGLKKAGVKRLLFVGGAGSLEVAPGLQLVDTPAFPNAWKGVALAHRDAWQVFQAGPDLDWTYLAPAAMLEPGERTGKYRTGADNLVIDENGSSRISMEDYAVAALDELEHPKHLRQRMSVGY